MLKNGYVRRHKNALALFILFHIFNAETAAADWQLDQSRNDIDIYTRSVEDSEFKEFKAVTTIASSVDSILAVISDLDAYPTWFYLCKEAKLLKQIDFSEKYIYQQTSLPWPAKDRDLVYRSTLNYDKESGTILIQFKAEPDMYQETDSVRISKSDGTYLLKRLADNTVRVTWTLHSDPAGKLPAWITNTMTTDLPYKSLSALKEMVKEDKYQQASLHYSDSGDIDDWNVKTW